MRSRLISILALVSLACCHGASAQTRRKIAGSVSLPFMQSDQAGDQWMICQNGMLQQRGNVPIFMQGAMLLVNGENIQQSNNTNRATHDEKTGEIIFDCNPVNGVNITRHVLVRADPGYVRYIEVFKNTQGQPQTLDVQLQSRINFGFTNTQSVPDPTGHDRVIGWVGQTGGNRAVAFLTAGRGASNAVALNPQPENNLVQGDLSLTIPPGAEMAVMTIYATSAGIDSAAQFVNALKDNDALRDCPNAIRRELVNFNGADTFIGEHEVLRGTNQDVIELRNGGGNSGGNGGGNASSSGGSDQLNGTLRDSTFTLHTFYGDLTLPAEQLVGMISVGQFRPRQLLVTGDGQVFGGMLAKNSVSIELSSGQVIEVPLAQISRFGFRKRADETESADTGKVETRPMIFLRSGDRIAVQMPSEPIDFLSRFGAMKLMPSAVNAITFQSETSAVHTLQLTDGSHVSGLLQAQQLTVTLAPAAPTTQSAAPSAVQGATTSESAPSMSNQIVPPRTITIPVAAIIKMQLSAGPTEPADESPTLQLSSGDLLVGAITGTFKIETAFDTLTINGPEVRTLTHAHDAGNDVQVVLWDGSRISGGVSDIQLPCTLVGGTQLSVPVALIDAYNQPQPQASKETLQQIDATVKDLSADDWKTREAAESKLESLGPVVIAPLKSLSPTQPPEAQQRIEAILRKLSSKKSPARSTPPADE